MRAPGIVALALAALLLASPAGAVRRERSVFRSPFGDVNPLFDRSLKTGPVKFSQVWTWSGFRSALAGDPVVAGGRIVVLSTGGEVAAVDPMGGVAAWTVDLGLAIGVGALADGDRVYVATRGGALFCLDAADGHTLWSVDLAAEPGAAPRLLASRLLIGTLEGSLIAVDPADGSVRIRRPLPGAASTPVEPGPPGTVLIGTAHGMLLELDEKTLETRWRHYTGHAITAPPLYEEGRIFVGSADGGLRCLKAKSGHREWMVRLGARVSARPFVLGPYVYVLCYDDDIYVLRTRIGHLLTRVRMGHRLDAQPVITGAWLLVVPYTEGQLLGLALPGLQTAGTYDLMIAGEWFTTAPIVLPDRVALGYGRTEGKLLGLSMSGKPSAPPAQSESAPSGGPPSGGAPAGEAQPGGAPDPAAPGPPSGS